MKFCPLFTGCAVVVVAYRSASLVGVLTKEKLRHYLAFECAIREIAAVSDRHCLATDNPRTSVATISLSLSLGQIYARCSFPLASLALRHSHNSLACLVRGVYLHKYPPRQLRSR